MPWWNAKKRTARKAPNKGRVWAQNLSTASRKEKARVKKEWWANLSEQERRNVNRQHTDAERKKMSKRQPKKFGKDNCMADPEVRERLRKTKVAQLTPKQRRYYNKCVKLEQLKATDLEAYKAEVSRRISVGRKRAWRDKDIRARTRAGVTEELG